MSLHSLVLVTLAASCVSTSQALTASTAQWGVYHLPTFDDDIAAALLPNASELSLTFMRQGELWIMPQYWSANDSWYEHPSPAIDFNYSTCAFSNQNPLPTSLQSAWIVMTNIDSCIAGITQQKQTLCDKVTANWQPLVTPLPENLTLAKNNLVYIEDTDTVVVFGGRKVVNSVSVMNDPLTAPVNYSIDGCSGSSRATNANFVAPVFWTFLYNIAEASWTALSPKQTGPGTPSVPDTQVCNYPFGLKSIYNPTLHTIYAIGAFDSCASGYLPPNGFAFLYAFDMNTWQWTTHTTSWGPSGAMVPACNVMSLLSLGMFIWADDEVTLITYGGVAFIKAFSSGACYALNVRTGNGTYLDSCSYGSTAAPFVNFDSAYTTIPHQYSNLGADVPLVVLAGGRHAADGGLPHTVAFMDQYVWVLWSSHASASPEFVWTQATVDVSHTTNSWAALGAAPATLTAAKLFPVVSPTAAQAANTFTFVAWGGLMMNASSEPLLEYNWWEGAQCYQMFDGFDTFQPLFSRTNVMHVLTLTFSPVVDLNFLQMNVIVGIVCLVLSSVSVGIAASTCIYHCHGGRCRTKKAFVRWLRHFIAALGVWLDMVFLLILFDAQDASGAPSALYRAIGISLVACITFVNATLAVQVFNEFSPSWHNFLQIVLFWPHCFYLTNSSQQVNTSGSSDTISATTPASGGSSLLSVESVTAGAAALNVLLLFGVWSCIRHVLSMMALTAIVYLPPLSLTPAFMLQCGGIDVPFIAILMTLVGCHTVSLLGEARDTVRSLARARAKALAQRSYLARLRVVTDPTMAASLLAAGDPATSMFAIDQSYDDHATHSTNALAAIVAVSPIIVNHTEQPQSRVSLRRTLAWQTIARSNDSHDISN